MRPLPLSRSPIDRTIHRPEAGAGGRGRGAAQPLVAVALALLVALMSSPAFAAATPPECGPGAGPCDEPNGTPGCDDGACCAVVCEFFLFCCSVEWDADCVKLRQLFPDECGGPANPACGPGTGPCFAPNSTPGCEDFECCAQICAIDPFCCEESWDFSCATVASRFCPSWPCTVECPPDAIDEGEPCGELINEGCNLPKPVFSTLPIGQTVCGRVWADDNERDTDWFSLKIPAVDGRPLHEVVITLTAEPAVALFLIDRQNCPVRQPIVTHSAFGGGCTPMTLHALLPAGTYAVVVTAGLESGPIFNGFPCGTLNAYTLHATLVGGKNGDCRADLNNDGVVDGADLGVLLEQWGEGGSADLNGDGVVDGADLGVLLRAWGPCRVG